MFRRFAIFTLVASSLAPAQTLSRALAQAMAGRSGAAVVLSAGSGRILAGYRPEALAKRVARPGSTVKPFVLLELLRSGKLSPHTEFACRRRVQIGAHRLDCRHVRTVEAMNAERALAYSCNSFFTEMGARLTDAELTGGLRRAGFGGATHLVKTEANGYVRPVAGPAGLQLKAVGEEGIEVTPIQMAAAYRQLALQSQSPDAAMKVVLAGLQSAVKYGTAQGARVDGLEVAGKTGTATAEEGPWTHAWFAGFAPAGKPEIVVAVFLERGRCSWGGQKGRGNEAGILLLRARAPPRRGRRGPQHSVACRLPHPHHSFRRESAGGRPARPPVFCHASG
jgi:membrane peptidoglycan carboxypeptidase